MQKTILSSIHKELIFKKPAQTSRDTLLKKDTYIIELRSHLNPEIVGSGECAPIWGLSVENKIELENKIEAVTNNVDYYLSNLSLLKDFPSLRFALETARLDLNNGGKKIIFNNDFTKGQAQIPINGLIWMSSPKSMISQIEQKISEGFDCIKLKIGSNDFNDELKVLETIRNQFDSSQILIRLDANGAFTAETALQKLKELDQFDVHSIEQPIMPKQWQEMSQLCIESPIPIALDEELIGLTELEEMKKILDIINPQYLIFKPSLLGGFKVCEKWIEICNSKGINWWITSALESNIGLNAVAQWTFHIKAKGHQGLGTGHLFENNFPSALSIDNGHLTHS